MWWNIEQLHYSLLMPRPLFFLLILVQLFPLHVSIASYTYGTDDCTGDPVMIESFGNEECDPGDSNLLGVSTKTSCPDGLDHLLIQTYETTDCTGFPVMTLRYEANVCETPVPGESASVKYVCDSHGSRTTVSTLTLSLLAVWGYMFIATIE